MHKVLRALISSDLFLLGGFGLIQPVFAVFMLEDIGGATLTAAGIATAIQLVTKGIMQIVVSKWTDGDEGNRRELVSLFAGSVIMSVVPFFLAHASTLAHIYILQFCYGLGAAVAYPGWMVIYSRYARQEHAGYEWSIYSTVISFAMAATAAIGAYLADFYSFKTLFYVVGLFSIVGTLFIFYIFKTEFTRGHLIGSNK